MNEGIGVRICKWVKLARRLAATAAALSCLWLQADAQPRNGELPLQQSIFGAGYQPSFGLLRDTLYLLDSAYLEVRLDQQMIYQHYRSGRVEKYPCSTGNPGIPDGIATREGIFTIQWKAKKHMSQEFGVYLNYWMPFDGGIGFHGLEGHSYYAHLGKRQSSHGCVRISNETGARIFGSSPSGTVVYVHGPSPARLLRFADSGLTGLTVMEHPDFDLLTRRLNGIMASRWDDSLVAMRLALPARSRLTNRINVGHVDPHRVAQRPIMLLKLPAPSLLTASGAPPAPTPLRLPLPPLAADAGNDEGL
jgi:hypothetical protein